MAIKKGFTLSEVMIAMTVLGVIAAILVPAIMKNIPSTNIVMFRKAYSTLEKSINNLISDETNYPSDVTIIPTNAGGTSYQKGFNNTTATTNTVSGTTYNKFCYFLTDQFNTTSGGGTSCLNSASTGLNVFTTSDGTIWNIVTPASDTTTNAEDATSVSGNTVEFPISPTLPANAAYSYLTKIIVDVNTGSKSTDCSTDSAAASYSFNPGSGAVAMTRCSDYDNASGNWSAKPDRFIFGVRFDGKIQVGSGAGTDLYATHFLSSPTTNDK